MYNIRVHISLRVSQMYIQILMIIIHLLNVIVIAIVMNNKTIK